jgi:hypothetical protein
LPALVGLAMMITIAPLQSWLGNKIGGIRKATTTVSDARVKLMTEILNGVRPQGPNHIGLDQPSAELFRR